MGRGKVEGGGDGGGSEEEGKGAHDGVDVRFDVRGGDAGVGLEHAAGPSGAVMLARRGGGRERARTSGVMYSEMSSDQALESVRSLWA